MAKYRVKSPLKIRSANPVADPPIEEIVHQPGAIVELPKKQAVQIGEDVLELVSEAEAAQEKK